MARGSAKHNGTRTRRWSMSCHLLGLLGRITIVHPREVEALDMERRTKQGHIIIF